jgi:hypothetical protein
MEHALTGWRKSTHSGHSDGCVEVGTAPDAVGVRDTKDREGGTLAVSRSLWSQFIDAIKADKYQH